MSAFSLHRSSPAPPAGLIGKDAMEILPRRIRACETWCETFAVLGYPGSELRLKGLSWREHLFHGCGYAPLNYGLGSGDMTEVLATSDADELDATRPLDAVLADLVAIAASADAVYE